MSGRASSYSGRLLSVSGRSSTAVRSGRWCEIGAPRFAFFHAGVWPGQSLSNSWMAWPGVWFSGRAASGSTGTDSACSAPIESLVWRRWPLASSGRIWSWPASSDSCTLAADLVLCVGRFKTFAMSPPATTKLKSWTAVAGYNRAGPHQNFFLISACSCCARLGL